MSLVAAYVVPHPPLIIPEVGGGGERAIQSTIDAYREVANRIIAHQPQTIVITSPHAPLYRDAFYLDAPGRYAGDMGAFRAYDVDLRVACDQSFAEQVSTYAHAAGIPIFFDRRSSGALDHGTFIPLYFIREILPEVHVVRVGLSGLSGQAHRELGAVIARVARESERKVVFIASGDMSHKLKTDGPYGFDPAGPQFDRRVVEIFASGKLEELFALDRSVCASASECGLGSFQIMTGALEYTCAQDQRALKSEALSYEGPYGVGYAVASFELEPLEAGLQTLASSDPLVALARESVEHYVKTGKPLARPDDLPAQMTCEAAGVFVSLHKHGELRGCIGTIEAVQPCIADEIIANGISACSRDPRFAPVREDELDALSYSVDVLGKAEAVASADQLDPARFGVIVTKGLRRGLLLPDLEGVDTVDFQLAIAKRKASIEPRDTDVRLERFEVVRHDRGGEARVP